MDKTQIGMQAMYEYKMVQIPPNVSVSAKAHRGNEAAAYLEREVNKWAAQGWEFFRVDTVGVSVQPGCIGGLLGEKSRAAQYYVISFRKRKEPDRQAQAAPAKPRSQPPAGAPATGRAVFQIDDK